MLPTYGVGEALLAFTLVCVLLLAGMLIFSWLVRPSRDGESDTYECGMEAEGNNRTIGFNYIGYAVLFLVFDLGALYLILYALARNIPVSTTIGFIIGIATLLLLILFGTQRRKYYVA